MAIVKNLVCNLSIDVNALGEGMEGVIVADLTFISSFFFGVFLGYDYGCLLDKMKVFGHMCI